MSDAQIIDRWSQPNEIRKESLNKLDGFSWEEASTYDELERRESMLLDFFDERPLTMAESEELKTIQRTLWEMDEAVRARKKPVSFNRPVAA